jgi:hypothetical protein
VRSLKEFLYEQGERLKTEPSKAAARRDEWVAAVGRLVDQITEWVHEADEGHILTLRPRTYSFNEEGIGEYQVDGLTIELEPFRIARVVPVGRNVARPILDKDGRSVLSVYGRVDLTNDLEKYFLYRVMVDPHEPWVITSNKDHSVRDFDRESFEAAFQDLLA